MEKRIYEQRLLDRPDNTLDSGEAIAEVLLRDQSSLYFGSFEDLIAFDPQHQLRAYTIEEGVALGQGFCLQKDSEFRELFDYFIVKMRESGLMRSLYQKYLPQMYGDNVATTEAAAAAAAAGVAWSGVIFPFAILAGSVAVSFVVLAAETGLMFMSRRKCQR